MADSAIGSNLDPIDERNSSASNKNNQKNQTKAKLNKNKIMILAEGVTLAPTSEITWIKQAPPKSTIQIEDYWKRRRDDQAKIVEKHDKIVQRKQIFR